MSTETFRLDLLNGANARATIEQTFTNEAFVAEVADHLAEAEEVEQLEVLSFEGIGRRNRKLAVHGFDLNDSDNSIALAVLHFDGGDDLRTLSFTDASARFKALQGFLEDSISGDFREGREESSPEYQLSEDLRMRGRNVSRYRLYLLSDRVLRDTGKSLPSIEIQGIPTDFHVWDVRRLQQVRESLSGRESLVIDLTEWSPSGLPALEVVDSSSEMRTYLAAVPGDMLADLYGRHGSRLLEGNVRSYLSNRGKVNKGIRTTVAGEAANFLAYNNGITATATAVSTQGGGIATITDLQIVNGGQTTASLFYVKREGRGINLDDIFVQMKLVVVEPEISTEMIPKISRYANSQNRVSEADFFSNSPFHVRLSELSQRVLAPAQAGVGFQTKWFYERTRGAYQNERNKRTPGEQRKYEAEYPKAQVIDKTAAAKYEVTWGLQPHVVSQGAQKNFMAFAGMVAEKWAGADTAFNELYWKHLVVKGILFENVRKAIAKAPWYEKGYLANYTTYTVAKLAKEVGTQARGGVFDLDRIWENQAVSQAVLDECLAIGEKVQMVMTSDRRPIQNVTEWAKRSECWDAVRALPHKLSPAFLEELGNRTKTAEKKREAAKVQKIDSGIAAQAKVVSTQPSQWLALEQFAKEARLMTAMHASLLAMVTGRKSGFPTEAQSTALLKLLARAVELGFEEE